MSKFSHVADTSALIRFMEGDGAAGELILGSAVHISVATEIELRTMSAIKRNAKEIIDRTLAQCHIWDISPSIKEQCIAFRSTYRLKLADALIAATASSLDLPLFTFDKDFQRLKNEIQLIDLKGYGTI